MSKIRQKSGHNCMICLTENLNNGVIIHKTRRQSHVMCIMCITQYLKYPLQKIINNLQKNIRKNIQFLKCPGTYHGQTRNQCSHMIDITTLNIPLGTDISTDIFRAKYVIEHPTAFLCPEQKCGNVLDIDATYDKTKITCTFCSTTWCKQCLRTPYHSEKTCLEIEIEEQKGDNVKLIWELSKQGKVKFCPSCKSPTYRDGGCNKMYCESCGKTWCWLCLKSNIDYEHYNYLKEGRCSGKLWEGEEGGIIV